MHVATHTLCGCNCDNITTVLDGTHKITYIYKNDSPSQAATRASSSTQHITQVQAQGNAKNSTPQPATTYKKTTPSPQAARSYITCYKCGGQGHKSFECTNKKVMIVNDNGDNESMSEDEYHALNKVATMQSLDDADD